MKTRNGFVSNSSSASFVVALSVLTEKEIRKIKGYADFCKFSKNERIDYWEIYEETKKGIMSGYTIMDNGSLCEYLGDDICEKIKFLANC